MFAEESAQKNEDIALLAVMKRESYARALLNESMIDGKKAS
jgi:hypothetical protein